MTTWTLILRSLRHHARAHAGVLLGAAVGSAVLIGALLVGDSVRASLREMALQRLGRFQFAMASGDRFFTQRSAGWLAPRWPQADMQKADHFDDGAMVLQLPGTATTGDGTKRANQVQVLGVDSEFANQERSSPFGQIPTDSVVLNRTLAQHLNARPGDQVLLRIVKPSQLSRDAPLASQEDTSVAWRLTVHAIASEKNLGNFSLRANQVAPYNAFVPLAQMQQKVGVTNRVNLVLGGRLWRGINNPALHVSDLAIIRWVWGRVWRLADAELKLRPLPERKSLELRTPRVFLDPPVVQAAFKAATNGQPIITYFVNNLQIGGSNTPYSMVTAMGAPVVPPEMRDDEILLNQWLADDLGAKPGDRLSLSYYIVGPARRLEERTNEFRVRAVLPLAGAAADRELMPLFPGLTDAESCRDWDTGFPIQMDRMRDKDQKYWDEHRGTPKAFVTLAAGERMWSNRFGTYTAVRFPLGSGGTGSTSSLTNAAGKVTAGVEPSPPAANMAAARDRIEAKLLAALDPASVGLVFQPVREQALAASAQAQDFGGLFIGFSFFLIVAALVLMALLFQFGVEQRATEVGTLLALGFTPARVRRLLLLEGAALALLGGLLGMVGGIAYARAMLHGLTTIWRDAVGTSSLHYHASPVTLVIGAAAAVLVAVGTIWFALRKQVAQPARVLLAGGMECGDWSPLSRGDLSPSHTEARASLNAPLDERSAGRWRDTAGSAREGTPLAPDGDKSPAESGDKSPHSKALGIAGLRGGRSGIVGAVALVFALALVGWGVVREDTAAAGLFFGAGALLLVASLAFTAALLSRLEVSEAAARLSLAGMGVRNATRRRRRSLATVAMLACGSFLIVSIGAFRLDENANATKRSAGTGGFAFLGESTLPVIHDLNSKAGREFFTLDEKALAGVDVVPFRVRDGDDASCLNLNRAQKPRLLGVRPELLAQRGAFTFAGVAKGIEKSAGWNALRSRRGNEADNSKLETPNSKRPSPPPHVGGYEIAGIADEASILWALGKKLGDTLDFVDERGQPFKVRLVASLANSILQGSIVIDHDEFVARFPNEAGYRMFLVDAPTDRATEVSATLTRALRDVGLELTPATRRLAQLNAVQNTYLSTFQVLGGLGLLLGSVGLGVVVLRNVLERRGELALLLAVGFRPASLRALVLSEHGALLLLGLGCGVAAAAVAVLPALRSPGAEFPVASLSLTLGAVLASGALWTWAATRLALRGRLLDALRSE